VSNVTAKFLAGAIIVGLVLLGMGIFIRSLSGKVDPPSLEVHRGPFEIRVNADGVLRAENSTPVGVNPRGQVLVWLLPEGTMVKTGDLLARFDDTNFRDEVAENRTGLDIALARLRQRQEELQATDEDLKSRTTLLEADLAASETELKRLQSLPRKEDLERARLDLEYATRSLEAAQAEADRYRTLAGKGVVMASDLKDREMAAVTAKADCESSRIQFQLVRDGATAQELETSKLRTRQVRIDLDQTRNELPGQLRVCEGLVTEAQTEVDKARARLDESNSSLEAMQVKSPADGMLVHRTIRGRKVEPGTSFWASASLFDIVDVSRMFVRVKVLESEVRSVKEGQPAQVRVVTMPDRVLKGRISKVAKVGKDKSEDELMTWREMRSKAGVQAFDVEVVLEETEPRMRPNVSAEVTISVERLENVIKVPLDAVFTRNDQPVVRLLTWRGPTVHPVQLGTSGSDWVVVTDGLTDGDKVVLSVPDARDGLKDLKESVTSGPDNVPESPKE
jgi:HlyD family secretion protein